MAVSRYPALVRDAEPADAAALLAVWADFVNPATCEPSTTPEDEVASSLARISADPDERLLVGVVDGRVVGAVCLRYARLSPIHTETVVHLTHMYVVDNSRRSGLGRALVEAAVTWAEGRGAAHVVAASSTNSRESNRFMARLGLRQIAMIRASSVASLRAKLPGEVAAVAQIGTRPQPNLGQVLAQRRSVRQARTRSQESTHG